MTDYETRLARWDAAVLQKQVQVHYLNGFEDATNYRRNVRWVATFMSGECSSSNVNMWFRSGDTPVRTVWP